MERLPEDTLSKILSLTSPMEASRFAMLSKGFKSAADSDSVWDSFLLSDLPEIVSRSVSPVKYATKKELYLTLCHSPILLDAGRLSFGLDKKSGKKCYMVGARELWIPWSMDTPQYWDWIKHPDSRFPEVAHLRDVCWLEIQGGINTRLLSWNTIYGAYLVFKLDEGFRGLESANALVRFVDDEVVVGTEDVRDAIIKHINRQKPRHRDNEGGRLLPLRRGDGLREPALVRLQPATTYTSRVRSPRGRAPLSRDDGWMEVEMGSFWNERGDDGDVELRLLGDEGYYWKFGLIVQGLEFRSKSISTRFS